MEFIKHSKYASEKELYRDVHLQENEKEMLEQTLVTFDTAREIHGGPLGINSGRRSHAHQLELKKKGFRTADTSPHEYGVAIDVDVPDGFMDEDMVDLIREAAKKLGLPTPRIGWKQYRLINPDKNFPVGTSSSFVHFDYAFLLPASLIQTLPPKAQKFWPIHGLTW